MFGFFDSIRSYFSAIFANDSIDQEYVEYSSNNKRTISDIESGCDYFETKKGRYS